MTTTCVNLRERFGSTYRIGNDPAAGPRPSKDPWMMTILCSQGEIYPHGGTRLGFQTTGGNIRLNALAAHPLLTPHQRGDAEATYLFEVADFEKLAPVLKPRKRKVMSEEQREKMRGSWERFAAQNHRGGASE